ncbi:MAG: serine hydrolase [Ignavibacteriales bacterium]|nr:serine hydrolase [Ignavibacteriales bacterium]
MLLTQSRMCAFHNPSKWILLLLLTGVFSGICTAQQVSGASSAASTAKGGSEWVESTLQHLTLQEKVSQLIFPSIQGSYYAEDAGAWRELERLVVTRKVGGLVLSIGDVYEYAVQMNRIQELADVPLLVAGDFEYGVAMRVPRATAFPRAMAIGATRNVRYAFDIAKATALEGRALGVQQNYAPTIDVNNNPRNPVINTRSFGDDVTLVSDMGAAYVKGTQAGGMVSTIKHFPGHGDTDIDTHLGLVTLNLDKKHFETVELPPFKAAIRSGAMSVMVGHLAAPALDTGTGIPATVSPRITTDLLRNELHFDGLIVTDAMRMRAVSGKYGAGEASVLALKAGTDVVLMPADIDVAIDAVVAAVRRGEISERRIDASVRKLLKTKQWAGLDRNRFVDIQQVSGIVASREHEILAREVARKAVTVLGNRKDILPLSPTDTRKFLDLVVSDTEDPRDGRNFHSELRSRRNNIEFAKVDPRSNEIEYDAVLESAKSVDVILCQLHLTTRSGEMTGFVSSKQKALLSRLASLGKPVIAIAFGNPYVIMDFPKIDAYVCAYSNSDVMQDAVAEVVFAESPAEGKLPVAIPGLYKFGDGVAYPKMRLRRGLPEEAGFSREGLEKVDAIVEQAIRDTAFPGAVLVIAKDGIIVHEKAYGAYDYDPYSRRVDVSTIFDLASVTKVISTTSAMMRLVGEGKIKLDDPVVKYVPKFGQNGKEHITVYNLLVHNSGLVGWGRFFEVWKTPQKLLDTVFAAKLMYKTGDTTIYSDLGLITTGKIIEKVAGTTLDRFVDSVFFKPLGMSSTMFNPPERLWNHVMPTEVDNFWRKTGVAVRGTVHDENAWVLGGVSGHAGLFSTAPNLAILLQMELNGGTYGGKRYLREDIIRQFTTRQSEKSTRGIGWDMKPASRSWAGTLLSTKTFLHTGFTGTSVAADPERNLVVVFLTNRVYPTRDSQKISAVRPQVHDAVVRALRQE